MTDLLSLQPEQTINHRIWTPGLHQENRQIPVRMFAFAFAKQ